jgi:hypothetical protein
MRMLALDPKALLSSSVEVNPGVAPYRVGQCDMADFVDQALVFESVKLDILGKPYYEFSRVDEWSDPVVTLQGPSQINTLRSRKFLQDDPTDPTGNKFQILRKLRIVYPARRNDPEKVAGRGRLPVVALVHGNHNQWDGSYHIPNHIGYTYLQQELASCGIVSVSVDTNVANVIDSLFEMRAEMVLAALDELSAMDRNRKSRFSERLDFKRVGLMGHSRGGDAVVRAAILNAAPGGRKYGIRAVCSLAPTDYSGMMKAPNRLAPGDTNYYAMIYGALDGDVFGGEATDFTGTGFRHYDRAKPKSGKSMVFLDGCSHNRFNDTWTEDDHHLLEADIKTRLVSRPYHRDLAREYIGGLFRWWLLGKARASSLFDGTAANALNAPASIQWSFGRKVEELDDMEDAATPTVGSRAPGATVRNMAGVTGTLAGIHTNHWTGVLVLSKNLSSTPVNAYQLNLPVTHQDWSSYDLFTFRVCADADVSNVAASALPDVTLVFADLAGKSEPISLASLATKPRRPTDHVINPKGEPVSAIRTVIRLETLAVDLDDLKNKVDLSQMKSVAIMVPPNFAVHQFVDSLQLIKR